ncbi:MAG: penicillin-binding transpeptidase domain-containing protein [Acidobacteriota bacterium]|jgi:penicillin-binding protein 2
MVFKRVLIPALLALLALVGPVSLPAATAKKPSPRQVAIRNTPTRTTASSPRTAKPLLKKASFTRGRAPVSRYRQRRSPYAGFWTVPNFADATAGDNIDGEDLAIRRAAVEALNGLNGAVVVSDANTGRILTMVNQKLALQNGFQPCSTIKILASVAGVMEGEYNRSKVLKLSRREYMDMTVALARSNNPYFATIGRKLGYEKISYYAKLLGLGETAGLNIPGEQPGIWPDKEVASGIGMMTSFGDGINLTPLQLTSILTTVANGGTMYYLQYPRSQAEVESFTPQVRRRLAQFQTAFDEIRPGMQGAVEFGSGRRAAYEDHEPIFGKTGTCTHSDHKTHLGWFGSFNEVGDRRLVVTVLLTGGKLVSGPVASGVAGQLFRILNESRYFASNPQPPSPNAVVSADALPAYSPEN